MPGPPRDSGRRSRSLSCTPGPPRDRSLSCTPGPPRDSGRRSRSASCTPGPPRDTGCRSRSNSCTPSVERAAGTTPLLVTPVVCLRSVSSTPVQSARPETPAEFFKRLLVQLPTVPRGRTDDSTALSGTATAGSECQPAVASTTQQSESGVRPAPVARLVRSTSERVRCSPVVPIKRCVSVGRLQSPARQRPCTLEANGALPPKLPGTGVASTDGKSSALAMQQDAQEAAAAAGSGSSAAPLYSLSLQQPVSSAAEAPAALFYRLPLSPRSRALENLQQRFQANARHRPMVRDTSSPESNSSGGIVTETSEVVEL